MSKVEIQAIGFEALRQWILRAPEEIPLPSILQTLDELRELGETVMAFSIMETTGDKATGGLASSIEGEVEQISDNEWRVSVGSSLIDAFYAAQDIRPTAMNRPVQIMPSLRQGGYQKFGKWRWIGIRPPMPAHPFLGETIAAWEKAMPQLFGGHLEETATDLEADVKTYEAEEEA